MQNRKLCCFMLWAVMGCFMPGSWPVGPFVSSAGALEISLEENKGEKGSVGFVEIERVFKEYPETLKAKEDFQAQIRKKEKVLNEKKSEIFALKAGISRLRQEKEFAKNLPMRLEPVQTEQKPAPTAPSTSTPREQPSASGEGPVTAQDDTRHRLPVPDKSADTGLRAGVEVSTSPATALQAPAQQASTSTPREQRAGLPVPDKSADTGLAAEVEVSTPSQSAGPVLDMPGIKSVPLSSVSRAVSTSLAEIDSAIREKENELARKEAEFKGLQRQVERELLDYESQRTQIILGKIYQVMRELALSEGISVVVDKRSILYGQSAVDLTDKLIKKLRGF